MNKGSKNIAVWLLLVGMLALSFTARAHQDEAHQGGADQDYSVEVTPELAHAGEVIYIKRCLVCHNTGSQVAKAGPGLKGLFKAKLTPAMKHPVTDANIRDHIRKGGKKMPAFPRIRGKDMDSLIAYLKTL